MADIFGAAAGCGMVVLIGMLIGAFLCETGTLKRQYLMNTGWALLTCGLTAATAYGLLFVMCALVYGGSLRFFSDVVQHAVFYPLFYEQHTGTVSTWVSVNVLVTMIGHVLLYFAFLPRGGEKKAKKAVLYANALPGMECCYLPMGGCAIWLIICIVLFVLKKRLPADRLSVPKGVLYTLLPVAVLLRCCILYRLMAGV